MSNRKNDWQRKEVKSSQQLWNESWEGKQADRCYKVDLSRKSQAFRKAGTPFLTQYYCSEKVQNAYHVEYGKQKEEVVECLVGLLCGEDDKGEKVANQTKTSNHGK